MKRSRKEQRHPRACRARTLQVPHSLRPVIGLLGGIGAGKSLVAAQFAQCGCAVVDADRIGHKLLERPGIRRALVKHFGKRILNASGVVDRRLLAAVAFASPENLRALEAIVHPELWRRVKAAVQAARRTDVPAVVLDAALILEKGLDKLCTVVLYIEAPEEVRRIRARQQRGWEPAEVTRREAVQVSLKAKRERADYIIDNSRSPEHTLEQIRRILSCIAKS